MFKLAWQPEQYAATGNTTAEGARNQLGRPELDPLTVLVREAAQNSWDAQSGTSQVTFGIAGRMLDTRERMIFRDEIFADRPTNMQLDRLWKDPTAPVLFIYDRGTTGLTGPTRADLAVETEDRNFVAFLRNIGQPRKATFGGGTYGYGKAVFYSTSSVGAICVYTQCRAGKSIERRFMAAALGTPCGKQTGRHWWGTRSSRDGVVEPLTGESAELMAEKLNFPSMKKNETGTTIMLLLPEFGDVESEDEGEHQKRSPGEAVAFMGASMLWHFWPKLLVDKTGQAPIRFELWWDGQQIPVPDPERHVAFHGFVNAMHNVKKVISGTAISQTSNEQVLSIACKRPVRDLGFLSLYRYPLHSAPAVTAGSSMDRAIARLAPSRTGFHQVALMRNAEIVVRYEDGPPSDNSQYAGVFLVDRNKDTDRTFANSEPPTHDDWEPNALEGWDKTFVRVALRRVGENIVEFANAGRSPAPAEVTSPLGELSEQLAGLVGAADGTSPTVQKRDDRERPPAGSRPQGKPHRASVEVVGEPELVIVRKQPACRIGFTIVHAPGSGGTRVSVSGRVAVLDGSVYETDPPPGADSPRVLLWERPDGTRLGGGEQITVPVNGNSTGVLHVTVSIPENTMIGVFLEAEAVSPEATA